MPRAYIEMILSSKPVNRLCPSATILGSKLPCRSRGVSSSSSPKSPFSVGSEHAKDTAPDLPRQRLLLRLCRAQFQARRGPEAPPGGGNTRSDHPTLKQPCWMHLCRAALPFCYKRPLTEMPRAIVPQTAPSHPCPRSSEWRKQ